MGGSHSRNTVNDVSNVVMSAVQNNMASCSATGSLNQSQNNVFAGKISGSDVTATQTATFNLTGKCVANTANNSNAVTQIQKAIGQNVASTQQQLTGWMSAQYSDQDTNMTSNISNSISQTNLTNCSTAMTSAEKQNNVFAASADISDSDLTLSQNQEVSVLGSCLLSGANTSSNVVGLTNTVNQQVANKETSILAPFVQMFGDMQHSVMAIVMLIVFCVLVFIGVLVKGASALFSFGGDKPPPSSTSISQ